jgi:hypothetical protein
MHATLELKAIGEIYIEKEVRGRDERKEGGERGGETDQKGKERGVEKERERVNRTYFLDVTKLKSSTESPDVSVRYLR